MASPESPPQPALATTKRKFHKLLDNLAASTSSTSLASTLQESNASATSIVERTLPEPPQKRSRVTDLAGGTRTVSGSDRIRAIQEKLFTPRKSGDRQAGTGIRTVNQSSGPVKLSTPRKEPNFQPHSQEQFLGRLKTFADVKKWTNKPEAINEVQWAKRGWVCDTWNTVACKGGCEQRVVVKLYPRRKDHDGKEIDMTEDMIDDVDEGLIQKFGELIVEGHYEDCLWRKRGCMDDIYHIPIPNRVKTSAELLERYRSSLAIADELPLPENFTYPGPSIEEILKDINQTFFTLPDSSPLENFPPSSAAEQKAFVFALFGWSGMSESNIALATCNHCFQRVGLWLYKDEKLKASSSRLDVPVESLRLDLLESHREHCPWKSPQSQSNPPDGPVKNMAAWETLEYVLRSGRGKKEEKHTAADAEAQSYRGSIDSDGGALEMKDADNTKSLNEKWRKFKAKLRRTTSRKSLKSIKSMKSGKSVTLNGEKETENAD
ncbi:zf-C3HC-domain-containing protein [Westerdykella ornata]|uniref:Zf-C3HC-domain-containing protein n=1 Tax=Westerdykella ornata TaxID=318751 RepID=A0A6A6JEL6_WESOR|nr:zf-C3HC-domain-containing protein [Westerdykella ornata]KAF2274705.1 zf-C3HC-domain-containing protein [Westerdykella ornata]